MSRKTDPNEPAADDEVVIHLDLNGLAALMHAVEAALQTGRGELVPGSGVGLSCGSMVLDQVTLKMVRPKDDGNAEADPPIPADLAPS